MHKKKAAKTAASQLQSPTSRLKLRARTRPYFVRIAKGAWRKAHGSPVPARATARAGQKPCGRPMTAGSRPTQRTIDTKRGSKESSEQIAILREKWPLAFPVQPQDVRPLEIGVASKIAGTMDWSLDYAWGVLAPWKASKAYGRAVLCYDLRMTLEGEPAEPVDDEARELARRRLAQLERRQAAAAAIPDRCQAAAGVGAPQAIAAVGAREHGRPAFPCRPEGGRLGAEAGGRCAIGVRVVVRATAAEGPAQKNEWTPGG